MNELEKSMSWVGVWQREMIREKYVTDTLATWCKEQTHWKRPWCWERLKAGGEGDNRRWDGWMASPVRWTWVWANSRRWWRTGKPGMLQCMGVTKSRTWLSNWRTTNVIDGSHGGLVYKRWELRGDLNKVKGKVSLYISLHRCTGILGKGFQEKGKRKERIWLVWGKAWSFGRSMKQKEGSGDRVNGSEWSFYRLIEVSFLRWGTISGCLERRHITCWPSIFTDALLFFPCM